MLRVSSMYSVNPEDLCRLSDFCLPTRQNYITDAEMRKHSQAPYLQCSAQNSQANTKLGLFSNRMVCGGEQEDKEKLGCLFFFTGESLGLFKIQALVNLSNIH